MSLSARSRSLLLSRVRLAAPRLAALPLAVSSTKLVRCDSRVPARKGARAFSSTVGHYPAGLVQSHHLETNDPDGAAAFYSRVFPEWKFEKNVGGRSLTTPPADQTERVPPLVVVLNNRIHFYIHKLTHLNKGAHPRWLPCFTVDSVPDAFTLAQEKHGAWEDVAWPPIPAGSVEAWVRRITDPLGGMFLVSNKPSAISGGLAGIGAQPPATHLPYPTGAANWHDLLSTDEAKSAQWYSTFFGWKSTVADFPGAAGTKLYAMRHGSSNGENRLRVASILPRSALVAKPLPHENSSFWVTFFQAPDVQHRLDSVAAAGGSTVFPATKISNGTFAVARDNTGVVFGLFDRTDS